MVSTYYGRLISPQTSEPLTQTIYAFCLIQHQHSLESFKTKQQHQKKSSKHAEKVIFLVNSIWIQERDVESYSAALPSGLERQHC